MTGHRRLALLAVVGIVAAAILVATIGGLVGGGGGDSGDGGDEPSLAALDAELVALGADVYATSCASCHGASGEGQPNWKSRLPDGSLPAPPHDASGHSWHHADGLLLRIIRDGGAQFATATFRSNMPAFGEQLSERELRAVIELMRSWWGAEERAFQAQVSEQDPFP